MVHEGKSMGRAIKSRSHSFSGCWTCRRRRVKCDTGVPTCKRCKDAGLTCEGYGFRFDTPDGVQSSRRSMPADSGPDRILCLTNDEIDDHLAGIEIASGTLHKGPFSLLVFPQDTAAEAQEVSGQAVNSSRIRMKSSPSAEIVPEARPSGSQTSPPPIGLSNGGLIRRPHTVPHRFSLPEELSLLNLQPHEQRLFQHYMTYVTDQLSPLAGFVCSAYATIVPSIAISNQTSSHLSSNASTAVFHGVLGVAATSLSSASPTHRLEALHHERLALRHLRLSIEEGTEAYLTLAVAILLLLLFEHLSGRAREYRAHIQAGLRCLVLSAQREPQNSTVKTISEQFLLGCALGNITPQVRVGCLQRTERESRRGYLEEQTGLAAGMMDVIIGINAIHARGGQNEVSKESCEGLRRKLVLHKPAEEGVQMDSFIRRNGALMFYAANLYFLRAVQGVEAKHPDARTALESGLRQLRAMKPTGRELNNCIITWAGCMLGSECIDEEQQQSFMAWCESQEARGVMNLQAVTMAAQYSWKMKRETPEQYSLLWYQTDHDADEMWYANNSEIPFSPAGDGGAVEGSNLADTLKISEESREYGLDMG